MALTLFPPMRFRLHVDDWEQYGSDWYVYDEAALLRIPARELIEIERTIGMAVLTMVLRNRQNYADANLAGAWLARRLAGVQESFDDFNPMIMLADWEPVPAGDADPPEPSSSTSPATE